MDILFIAGFGPIPHDSAASTGFWSGDLGVDLEEIAPDYFHARDLDGARVFGMWPLDQAAQATFGTSDWPGDLPRPQAWIELEVASPEAVADSLAELAARGHRILVEAHEEPWGQTTGRLLTPEGLLLGISYMPAFHIEGLQGEETDADGRQRIPMRAAYEDAIREGRKLQTIRVDGPFATGDSVIVLEHESGPSTLDVLVTQVRRTTVAELTDEDAQADGYPDLPSFLSALSTHVPDLRDNTPLDVVTYRLADPPRS